jgi:hypothetical protein
MFYCQIEVIIEQSAMVIILVKSLSIIRSISFYFELDFVKIEDDISAG